jgi:CheY-like chemotaxis protein
MEPTRILIAEDEAISATALKSELVSLGYEVVGITDTAEDVVRAAGELQPDVVFMDITLKGVLDGITAAVAIRGRTGAPVVFLTAHADEKTMKRSVFAGPFEYILKPFTRKELQSAVQASLRKRQAELEDRAVLQR